MKQWPLKDEWGKKSPQRRMSSHRRKRKVRKESCHGSQRNFDKEGMVGSQYCREVRYNEHRNMFIELDNMTATGMVDFSQSQIQEGLGENGKRVGRSKELMTP